MKYNIKILIICFIFMNIKNGFSIENFENLLLLNDFKTTSLMKASADDNVKAIDILIKNDYNINAQNLANVSVLHYAVKNNAINALKLLIKNKVNLNIQDDEGFTPLMRACLDENFQIVKILIDNGSYLWTKNEFGESALFLALVSDCNQCAQSIIEADYKRSGKLDSIKIKDLNKAIKIAIKKENKEMQTLLTNYLENQNIDLGNDLNNLNNLNNSNNSDNPNNSEIVPSYKNFDNDSDTEAGSHKKKSNELKFIFNGRTITEEEFKQIQKKYEEILAIFQKEE